MADLLSLRLGTGGLPGESLWIGNIGHFLVILSFIMSGIATGAFIRASRRGDDRSLRLGRAAFSLHGVSVLGIFVLLFVMIMGHFFEYYYAWRHSSTDLPVKYIISSFWEGQEGSFLLWQFWHVVLGVVLMRRAARWEAPVMATVSLTQLLLGSMVLGVFVLGYKVGVNPFVLLRHEMADAPIFAQTDYLDFIQEGNGLNPLLQNYWMVIHPPVLFLGFASTVVPFAFVVAGSLFPADNSWVKPTVRWSLFAAAALGAGILMGGAWAYESLSFGGFWAWDPVENASLVPWILLVAGLHALVAYQRTGRGRHMAILFLLLTFILILYSTFLTRSGVLGDTSVHSFTDLGMTRQLLVYLFALTIPALVIWVVGMVRDARASSGDGDEPMASREFWMFVGSLVFLVSAVQIGFDTSWPVWNKLFGTTRAIADPVAHYNGFQIIVAAIIAALSAVVQFLAYRSKRIPKYFKWLAATLVLSVFISIGLHAALDIAFFMRYAGVPFLSTYFALTLTSVFAILSNALYLVLVFKGRWRQYGSSVAHIGFALMLVGVLISQHKQQVISINTAGIDYGEGFQEQDKRENVLLLRGDTVRMGQYRAVYTGKTVDEPNHYFNVTYERVDEATGEVVETFELAPYAQINPSMGLVSNPDTRHYLHRDIFTHVSSIPNTEEAPEDSVRLQTIAVGDTFFTSRHFVVLRGIVPNPPLDSVDYDESLFGLGGDLVVEGFDGSRTELMPVYLIDVAAGNQVVPVPDEDPVSGITLAIRAVDPASETLDLIVRERDPAQDFIILKAIVFPWINVLWLGAVLMVLGFLWSIAGRWEERASVAR